MGSLEIHGLTARYGSTVALHGIDLEIADREFFVILGPSGVDRPLLGGVEDHEVRRLTTGDGPALSVVDLRDGRRLP